MPLFTNKFTPKKTQIRKPPITDAELPKEALMVNNDTAIKLDLGNVQSIFENGEWTATSSSGETLHKANQKLRHQIQELKEENNLLKIKFDILLDMLTQTTAENHIRQKEIDKLKRELNKQ